MSPTRVAAALFWSAVGTLAATYVAIPAVLLVRGRLIRRPIAAADVTPTVTIVIAAFNEERSIGAKLDSLHALDYPRDRLEILVASDGSSDATNDIVLGHADRGVRLLDLDRVGKAAALNAALAIAAGEIVVFSDANSIFEPGAMRALVRPFADPEVGGVAGDQRYHQGGASGAMAEGERGYWDLDRLLKVAETNAGNVISATGAIYAVRRELIPPVIEGVTDDFITSTAVIAAGRRLVFAADAAAWEPVAASGGVEYGRKVRVMTRGLRGVLVRRALLDPRRTGFYAVQLLWHKLLRRLMVFPLIALAVSAPILIGRGWIYGLAAVSQAAFYSLALAGIALRDRPISRSKALALPAYFCLVNMAALTAALNVLRGRRIDRWETQRAGAPGADEPPAAGAPGADEPPAAEEPPAADAELVTDAESTATAADILAEVDAGVAADAPAGIS